MVDFKKLAQSASDLFNKRGGMKSAQEDAGELADIAKGEGSLSDKAKRGAEALKEPGAHREAPANQQAADQQAAGQQAAEQRPAEQQPAERQPGQTPGDTPAN
jgi:hypothetical protein